MASDPATVVEAPAPAPAPLSGTRPQALQRLQVGLFGLGTMVLLVGLANIVTNARQDRTAGTPQAAASVGAASDVPANDPLADAGVVPDMPRTAESPAATTPAPAGR